MRSVRYAYQFTTSVLLALSVSVGGHAAQVTVTHGVAAGDVTASSAIVWARSDRSAKMLVKYRPAAGPGPERQLTATVDAGSDFTAQVRLRELAADTLYRYEVQFTAGRRKSEIHGGLFRTAPEADADNRVALIWSGDLAGQTYCRRPGIGYQIFAPMRQFRPDFFVANGDMIYADNDCPEQGREPGWRNEPGDFPGVGAPEVDWTDTQQVRAVFDAHWRYNRVDPMLQAFFAEVPMYVQWDDHEVINDFGAPWDQYPPQPKRAGYQNVVAAGRESFFDYHPFDRTAARDADGAPRIYRSYRWGRHVELFILDARSYRSDNTDPDSPSKTMLGPEQLAWLKAGLAASDATWKIVSNDVPLSVPTGSRANEFGRDAFANGALNTGFETELLDLVGALDAGNVENVVFIATDVHSAAQIRYQRDYDGDGDELLFHELIVGPLSAIRGPGPVSLDSTLGPVLLYAEGGFFNYGTLAIDAGATDASPAAAPRLVSDVRDERGHIRPGSRLVLQPR